jgi:hypothetical protein
MGCRRAILEIESIPWLDKGYRFNQHVFFAFFSPYFLLFGLDPKLLTKLVCEDVIIIMNLDDLSMELEHMNSE